MFNRELLLIASASKGKLTLYSRFRLVIGKYYDKDPYFGMTADHRGYDKGNVATFGSYTHLEGRSLEAEGGYCYGQTDNRLGLIYNQFYLAFPGNEQSSSNKIKVVDETTGLFITVPKIDGTSGDDKYALGDTGNEILGTSDPLYAFNQALVEGEEHVFSVYTYG